MIQELVVISGKGGTGKTSLTASFALLADRPVVADGDVDAADLHLVLAPRNLETHDFRAGREAIIRAQECSRCGLCQAHCRFDAVRSVDGSAYAVDPAACEGCGVCVHLCPAGAIDFPERSRGVWMIAETRVGPMVHARLAVAAESSGKLVATVRREARRVAEESGRSLILVDGPPGLGCPVIAAVTGATLVLAVAEPTVSGEHDLERILALARHFRLPAAVCVNKWDLNPGMAGRIEAMARREGARPVGRIGYDQAVTRAQLEGKAVVELGGSAAEDVRRVWRELKILLIA